MTPDEETYLRNLCRILEIPLETTEANPELALNILARMYLVPTIDNQAERNRTLNEIRGNLNGYQSTMGAFISRTAVVAVMMQDYPYHYDNLNEDTDVLVEKYKSLERGVYWLGIIGIGAGGGALAAGAVEGSRTGSARQGAVRAGERLLGRGAVLEEIQRRMGTRIPAGRAGVVGAVVIVGGTLGYYSALEQMEEIRAILMERFQRNEMGDDQFREVFGSDIDPDSIQRYWE